MSSLTLIVIYPCRTFESSNYAADDMTGVPCLMQVLAQHRQQLEEMQDSLRWVGYLSSTSVYGDHAGDWVDER